MRTSEDITKLAAALAKAQSEIEDPDMSGMGQVGGKTSAARKYPYALLVDVLKVARKALGANGIMVTQAPDVVDGRDVMVTRLLHSSGQWMETDYPMARPTSDPQKQGSANTYARRYALMSVLGIAGELDDDGAGAKDRKVDVEKVHNEGAAAGRKWLVQQWLRPAHSTFSGRGFAAALKAAKITHTQEHIKLWCLWLGKDKPSRMNDAQRTSLITFLGSEQGEKSWASFVKECGPLPVPKPRKKKNEAPKEPEEPTPPADEPVTVWSSVERERFEKRLAELDWPLDDVAAWCEGNKRPHPRNMSEDRRKALLVWLVEDKEIDGKPVNGGQIILDWQAVQGGEE